MTSFDENMFLSAVNVVASKHGCNNVEINAETKIVNFDCDPEKEVAIATELANLFERG